MEVSGISVYLHKPESLDCWESTSPQRLSSTSGAEWIRCQSL